MHSQLDYGLKWLDTWQLEIDDLGTLFPAFKNLLMQRRLHIFNVSTVRRNKAQWEDQTKKEMPATIQTVQNHIAKQIKSGEQKPYNFLFKLSKNAKEDSPLTGFVEYFAYKIEERKYNLLYSNGEPQKVGGRLADIQPVIPVRAWFSYVTEKTYNRREFYIGRE